MNSTSSGQKSVIFDQILCDLIKKHIMRYALIITLLAFSLPVQAQTARELLLQGRELLDDGTNRRDIDALLEARTIFEQVTDDDSLAMLAYYYAASASSDIATILTDRGASGKRQEIRMHINYSIENYEASVEIDETFAEGWALLSTSYAHKISVSPLRAVGLARKYNWAMSIALELEPDNPRIVLLKGIMDYNIPRIAGGNKERGIEGLERAIDIFSEERAEDPLMPSWGHAHAHMRLGIAYMDQRELEKARSSFEQALEINPDFGWVKDELIPSLEELESQN
ncbi:MAG: tetratricopeptide repeat protein [Rhodothermaceae bacterium]|nr:tetratricopeptide repeat protein [Rhodothermaceae bacterium]